MGLVLAGLLRASAGALGLARGFGSSIAGPVVSLEHGAGPEEVEELDKALEDLLLTRTGSGPAAAFAFSPMSKGWCRGMLVYTRLAAGTYKIYGGGWEVGNPIRTRL